MYDIIMVIAILLAPLLAVQVQKRVEIFRETRQRKLYIFHTLMATRAARVSTEHVQALNMIDIIFYKDKSEKPVREAWKKYLDHLNNPPLAQDQSAHWNERRDDLFVDLLSKMAESLGYHFDDVHLKKGIYFPQAHSDQELAQIAIRDSLVKVLSGEKAIPMEVVSFPVSDEAIAKQDAIQTKLIEYLEGERTVKVKIEQDS